MNEPNAVSTWEWLQDLGFAPDNDLLFSTKNELSFDFGNLKVSAISCINRHFAEIVLVSGVLSTPNSLAEISIELPPELDSREQGMAFLAWGLDESADQRTFTPGKETPWLEQGRQNFHQLPWIRDHAAYEARPRCAVSRDWARLSLNTLAEQLKVAPSNDLVTFSFNGQVLTICCGENVIATAATGTAWSQVFCIQAEKLQSLPKRLMNDPIEIALYDGALRIDRWRFDGVFTSDESFT